MKAPNPLLQVWWWELRRWQANGFTWAAAGVILLFFLGMIWFKHAWSLPAPGEQSYLIVVGTSGLGLIFEAINVLLLLLALIVPFAVTDGVARDQKERLHEVLMASPLSTTAYVWGRFLAILCVSLSLAVLALTPPAPASLHWSNPNFSVRPATRWPTCRQSSSPPSDGGAGQPTGPHGVGSSPRSAGDRLTGPGGRGGGRF